ncbi:MAG TPA: hypothetical protein VLU91_00180 [Nitrososphaerales archaeon]|nr:hypothetical protein [Nitrososphaerales archaeon]
MDYFAAVQEGRKRVARAVAVLQEVAGPSYPMLFLKLGISDWTPVGEEMMHKIVPGRQGTAALVICDAEGNAEAMSGWFSEDRAESLAKALEAREIPSFPGDVKLPI